MSDSTPTGDIAERWRKLAIKIADREPLTEELAETKAALTRLSSALDRIIAYAEECKKLALVGMISYDEWRGAEACAEIAHATRDKEQGT